MLAGLAVLDRHMIAGQEHGTTLPRRDMGQVEEICLSTDLL